jgi:hypothetical protein
MFTTAIRSQSHVALSSFRLGRAPALSSLRGLSTLLSRATLSSPVSSLPSLSGVSAVSRSFSRSPVAYLGHTVHNNPPSHVLFIGNLPWSATKEELQELFTPFGEVASIRLREYFLFYTGSCCSVCVFTTWKQTLIMTGDLGVSDTSSLPRKSKQLPASRRLWRNHSILLGATSSLITPRTIALKPRT